MSRTLDAIETVDHSASEPVSHDPARAVAAVRPRPRSSSGSPRPRRRSSRMADVEPPEPGALGRRPASRSCGRIAGLLIGLRRRSEPLGLLVAAVAACAAAALAGSATTGTTAAGCAMSRPACWSRCCSISPSACPKAGWATRLPPRPGRDRLRRGDRRRPRRETPTDADDRGADDRDGRRAACSSRSVSYAEPVPQRRARSSARGCSGPAGASSSPR